MDVGASTRVTLPQAPAEVARIAPKLPADAVRTELPAQKSVQQPASADLTRDKTPPKADAVDRNITIDLETQKVVFRAVDERTGEVLVQLPDPRYLKAYLDQKKAAETEEAGGSTVGRSV